MPLRKKFKIQKHNSRKRKREPMVTRFCDLPEKAVAEIMSWLPPESLVQCKCVQKSWRAFIDALMNNRWFVAKHLENFRRRSSLFLRGELLCLANPHMTPDNVITDIQLVNSYKVCKENDRIQLNSVELSSSSRPRHVDYNYSTTHCNGVIFEIDKVTNKITLCNPSTRKFKYLDPDSSCFFGSDFKPLVAGFGYDAIANVYKIVRVVRRSVCFGAEVFTLGTNQGDSSSWREIRMININIGNHFRIYASRGVYHRGFLYWVLLHESRDLPTEVMIISFDMHTEEFRIVPLPTGFVDRSHRMRFNVVLLGADGQYSAAQVRMSLWLDLWNGCVVLLKYVIGTVPSNVVVQRPVEMWTMKTDSSSSCGHERFSLWVKRPIFLPPLKLFCPIVFLNSEELLLGTPRVGCTVSYNLRTHKVRVVQLHPDKVYAYFDAFVCVKSLVWFND